MTDRMKSRGSRSRPGRPSGPRKNSRIRRRRGLGWLAVGLGLALFTVYAGYLDLEVRRQFEGKRWQVPARVFARPLELYPGRELTRVALLDELRALGYESVNEPARAGSYSAGPRSITVFTRDFLFWDGVEPERRMRVDFDGARIAALSGDGGEAIALARLEPLPIGGIYPKHREDRILVRLEEVPRSLIDALLAVEDRDFFSHAGIDPRAIVRALWANLRAGAFVQGGSTLTQQLVKNFFLTSERTLLRKLNEALMALLLEARYEKEEILEAYLNEVYLGQDGQRAIHGFGLASRFYFGRPLSELRLVEVAQLVALVRGPSLYDPRRSSKRAVGRRNLVIEALRRQGVITQAQAAQAQAAPLAIVADASSGLTPYPAFLDLVRRQLRRDYREEDLTGEGLRVFTTFDPLAQRAAEEAVQALLPSLERVRGLPPETVQGAVIVTDPQSGEVQAVVGGRQVRYAGFNRALDAARPVGSLVKPAIYLTALEQPQRFSLATFVDDAPLSIAGGNGQPWQPENYDRQSHGPVPLYTALAHSYNLAAVRLGLEVGVPVVAQTLQRLGVERELPAYPSLLLGAAELSPLEVTQLYQTLAGNGFRTPLRAIRDITTAQGEPLRRYPVELAQGVDARAAFLVTRALQMVVEEGTARGLERRLAERLRPAGKTGTTNDLRDSWFAGFTGDRLAVVWMGRDNNQPLGLSGATGALQVWERLMNDLSRAPLQPAVPDGVNITRVEAVTGRAIEGDCAAGVVLPFITGSEPRESVSCWALSSSGVHWP